jgi:hypothetical protein
MPVPPAFDLTLQLGRRERVLLSVWCGLSAGTLVAWLVLHGWMIGSESPVPPWLAPVAALLSALPAAALGWSASRGHALLIGWNDGVWRCASPGDNAPPVAGLLEPMIDLGVWMLLRFRSTEPVRTRWLVADASQAAGRWHDLRAALFQPAATAAAKA